MINLCKRRNASLRSVGSNSRVASCWTGWYEQKEMKAILNIPSDKYVVGVVTLGYGAENPTPRKRKELGEIVSFEQWN